MAAFAHFDAPFPPSCRVASRTVARLVAPILVAAAILLAVAPVAGAVTRGEIEGFADRVSAVWAKRQDSRGYFMDPRTGGHQGGYGNVMIGYGLLRAGARSGDAGLVRSGVRGVGTALGESPAQRGVFDLLAMAAAYNFARAHLAHDPAFAAARPRWERYLRQTGSPNIDNKAQACILSPACFHNHEAVGAAADLEMLRTGLRSGRPRSVIRRSALHEVGVAEPAFSQPDGLLSDSGVWPLAYHALSTAMLRRSIELLGPHAPAAARRALRRTVAALRGFMAPDGTVAYIGRRQDDVWSLAAAVASGDAAVADRAFQLIKDAYPLTGRGLPIVPRRGAGAFSPRGVDGKPMTFNGLAIYLLNIAADAPQSGGGRLTADRSDGGFVDDAQNGFAAVRHGDVWFAVHRRRLPPDLRNDFGLVALKWRSPSGLWQDILRPRPMRFDAGETAGPVIDRAGQRLLPSGDSLSVAGGAVVVRGRIGATPATFRYAPAGRGVRLSMRAQPGDVVTYTVYGPAGATRVHRGVVSYPSGVVKARPRPASVQVEGGFASCCDTRMVAARMHVRARGNGNVTFTVSAHGTRRPAPAASTGSTGGGGTPWWIGPLAAVAAVLLAATVRRDSTYRRRRTGSR
jgi:hypothetical protein